MVCASVCVCLLHPAVQLPQGTMKDIWPRAVQTSIRYIILRGVHAYADVQETLLSQGACNV